MERGAPGVLVAGHLCLDIIPAFPSSAAGAEIFTPGRLTQTGGIGMHLGGVVANTGLALKTLGASVYLCGKTGDDELGSLVRNMLGGQDAAAGIVTAPGQRTSYTIVLAPPGVDRIFLHDPGANDSFALADVDFAAAGATHLHFGYPPLMAGTWRDGGAMLEALLATAKQRGMTTSLDLAAVDEASPAGGADWQALLRRWLPYVDIVLPSAEETAFMLNRPLLQRWRRQAPGGDVTAALDIQNDIAPLAAQLLAMGAQAALVKCGPRGAYLATAAAPKAAGLFAGGAWAGVRRFEAGYAPARVASATGAGDACIAAFLYAALTGRPAREALRLAMAAGAASVEAYDSLSGVPGFEALCARLAAGWPKCRPDETQEFGEA